MKRCPVCGKDKSEFEMRPIVNVEELAMGDAVSDVDSKEDVGGAKLHVVCRSCWLALLESRSKEEVVELLETISGILFEVAKAKAKQQWSDFAPVIEKAGPVPTSPGIQIQPLGGQGTWIDPNPLTVGGEGWWSNGTRVDLSQSGTIGMNTSNLTLNLAEQFGNLMFGEDFHLGKNWTEGGDDGGNDPSV